MDLSLIPQSDRLDLKEIILSDLYEYKQLVHDDNWTPGPGSATTAAEPTPPSGYHSDLPTEPVAFQTMMCKAIYNAVADVIPASTQATPPPPVQGGGNCGRINRALVCQLHPGLSVRS